MSYTCANCGSSLGTYIQEHYTNKERARWVAAVEEIKKWMSENRMPDWEEGAHEALDRLITRMEASNE